MTTISNIPTITTTTASGEQYHWQFIYPYPDGNITTINVPSVWVDYYHCRCGLIHEDNSKLYAQHSCLHNMNLIRIKRNVVKCSLCDFEWKLTTEKKKEKDDINFNK